MVSEQFYAIKSGTICIHKKHEVFITTESLYSHPLPRNTNALIQLSYQPTIHITTF